jgi:hemerythrin-like metal-binding protein
MNLTTHRDGSSSMMRMLDRDHQRLSALLVELNQHVALGGAQHLQLRLLKELQRVSLTHFALEEGIMCATNYPGLRAHRLRHRTMVEQNQKFAENWSKRKSVSPVDSAGLLWETHVLHVANEDLGFDRWLNGGAPGETSGRRTVD